MHNFLETNNDSWEDEDNEINDSNDEEEEENNNLVNLNEISLKREGELKRNQIIDQLLV